MKEAALMTDADSSQPSSASVLLNRGLPDRLRLHISQSLGFRGYYSVFLSLSTEVILPRGGERGLATVYVINCVENNL